MSLTPLCRRRSIGSSNNFSSRRQPPRKQPMRSHALFSFDGAPKILNPYGFKNSVGSAKAAFKLPSPDNVDGAPGPFAADPDFLPEWGRELAPIYGATMEQFSLLAPIDHNPG